jgi:hypothetical protein
LFLITGIAWVIIALVVLRFVDIVGNGWGSAGSGISLRWPE